MRSRFIVAGALLGASVATSCFIPGFEVIEDGNNDTGGGGNATGGSNSGGGPLGGNGGEGCQPDPFDGRLLARGEQTDGPILTVDSSASIQLEDGVYESDRGFEATVAEGSITLAAGPGFFGWDSVEVQATDGCVSFPVTVDLRVSPVAGGAIADAADAVITGFSGTLSLGSADVNGDGVPDLIVGSPDAATGNGEVSVILGGPHLVHGSIDTSFLTTEDLPGFVITGNPGEGLGNSVAGAGDVNCSEFDSIVLGAATLGSDGNAYVVYGSANPTNIDLAATTDDARFRFSGGTGTSTGYAVAGGQDVNGDGVPDLVEEIASLQALKARLRAAGTTLAEALADEPTEIASRALDDWIEVTAFALAQTVLNAATLAEFELVVLDGALPHHVLERLVTATADRVARIGAHRFAPPQISLGNLGRAGAAQGAAMLQIYRRYFSRELADLDVE